MILGETALSILLVVVATATKGVHAFASADRVASRSCTSTNLFSTIDATKIVPPREVTGENAAEPFESHVQKTYG